MTFLDLRFKCGFIIFFSIWSLAVQAGWFGNDGSTGQEVILGGDRRALQLEDYLDWEWVADPQISPDGKSIIYTRRRINKQEDRFASELWVMDVDGGRNRRLMEQAVSEVTWSPDSTRIAYIAGTNRGREVFLRWMDAQGNITQVTRGANQPSNLSWSPNGKTLAFCAFVPASNTWDIELPAKPAGANWAEDAIVVDKLHYRKDGIGKLPPGYKHIFVVSAEGGVPWQLTRGNWHAGALQFGLDFGAVLEWSKDSKAIIFSADREAGADLAVARSSLYAVNVATRELRQISTTSEYSIQPRVSPDGNWIAFIGMAETTESNFASRELHVVRIDGRKEKTLVSDIPSYWVSLRWAQNSKGIFFVRDKEGAHNLHYVSLNGEVQTITSGQQSLSLDSVSDNGIAVGTRSTVYEPTDVVRFNIATGRNMQRLTSVNDDVLTGVRLGKVEEIWYDSTDDVQVQGWIVYPPDFDASKKYPLILDIHGGPEWMYSGNFDFTFQEWAARGYIVLYTNPRGSTGYSSAFTRAIYNAYPGRRDYEDLMHGVDTVVAKGFIDEKHMYVEGCSGGGVLTAWVVTQTDRFAGAATMCPTVNNISTAGTSDVPTYQFNRFKDYFWENPAAWLEHSAIMRVNKVKTPTLIMVGEHDIRTPVGQSQEFYTALKMLGVPSKLILLKGEGHATWLSRSGHPSNFLRSQLYLRKWFSGWRRLTGKNGPELVHAGSLSAEE